MIHFEQVHKRYPNGREALSDVTLNVSDGEMVFLHRSFRERARARC